MSVPEFSYKADIRALPAEPVKLRANEGQRAALAERFALVEIRSLSATIELVADGGRIRATGQMIAKIVQSCAISGEDLRVSIKEPLKVIFVPERTIDEGELELEEADCDELSYSGKTFDLGEAVAQNLALAIDPYLTGPNAEEARAKAGLSDGSDVGPFAALAALKKDK